MMLAPGVQAQLLAVGLSNGEVALYKLWNVKGGEPVRVISLADWGFEPETSGSVADLQWSPDNRAIAVRFIHASCICMLHVHIHLQLKQLAFNPPEWQ